MIGVFLLPHGSKVYLDSHSGPHSFDTVVTPLYMARKYGHRETAKLLERNGGISFPA